MLFLHTAKNGDNINEIAERFRTTPEDIKRLNGLRDDSVAGRRLLIRSDMEVPGWAADMTLWFDELTCRQLSGLMYEMCASDAAGQEVICVPVKSGAAERPGGVIPLPETSGFRMPAVTEREPERNAQPEQMTTPERAEDTNRLAGTEPAHTEGRMRESVRGVPDAQREGESKAAKREMSGESRENEYALRDGEMSWESFYARKMPDESQSRNEPELSRAKNKESNTERNGREKGWGAEDVPEKDREPRTKEGRGEQKHDRLRSEKNGLSYIVKEGDTPASIASQYGLTARILQKSGGLGASLTPGTEITIPAIQGRRYFYTVRLGDTPEKIANKFGLTRDKLMQINYIDEKENLLPGIQLLILI